MRRAASFLLLVTLTAPQLAAQSPLSEGTRVRVSVSSGAGVPLQRPVGVLERLRGDTVVLAPGVAIHLPEGSLLEASRGYRGHAATGAVIGGVTLGLAGALTATPGKSGYQFNRGGAAILLGTIGLASGALIGAAVGALIRSESWVRVQWAGVRIGAHSSAAGLEVSIEPTASSSPARCLTCK